MRPTPDNGKGLETFRSCLHALGVLLGSGTVRERVLLLDGAHKALTAMGQAALPSEYGRSAKSRILAYLRAHAGQVIDGDELRVVAGISEYARRVRELRVEEGWPIVSGVAAPKTSLSALGSDIPVEDDLLNMRPNQYCLVEDRQDTTAADRWRTANQIRRKRIGSREKLLAYFREYVGKQLTLDELRYVAGSSTEWARRVRELRTEQGWPIVTRTSGDPRLPRGVYVLKSDRQDEPHDRHIPELTRRAVLKRDRGRCRWEGCGWPEGYPESDSRFLELHHVEAHADRGTNEEANLVTLCNLHHDAVHKGLELRLAPL